MKIRHGFVSNSSSTSFLIRNTTDEDRTLEDFAKENVYYFEKFYKKYHERKPTEEEYNEYYKQARAQIEHWAPGQEKAVAFGDEMGDVLDTAFDYTLRDGGRSESFEWRFNEWLR